MVRSTLGTSLGNSGPVGRPDIRQVAAEAGVSTATVSRVLSGRGPASAAATLAVHAAVEHLHYVPSASASSLRTARSMIIGVLVPNLANPVFLPFLRAVEHLAQRYGYSVIVADTQHSAEVERRQLDRLSAQRIDALILAGRPRDAAQVRRLSDAGVVVTDPVIFAEQSGRALQSVGTEAVGDACRRLQFLGHTRVAFVAVNRSSTGAAGDRWRLIDSACQSSGLEPVRMTVPAGSEGARGVDIGRAGSLFDGLVRSPGGPTVIWSNSHVLAPRLLESLALADITIPTECSFLTFGDSPWAAAYRPSISVVTDDLGSAATMMTSAVLHQLGAITALPAIEVPPSIYRERGSVGPAPHGATTG
jgi:DNA-binding LacI/PurR family transcriptional regulator